MELTYTLKITTSGPQEAIDHLQQDLVGNSQRYNYSGELDTINNHIAELIYGLLATDFYDLEEWYDEDFTIAVELLPGGRQA